MKKIVLFTAALALVACSAFASGIDLSVVACPGNAGASSDAGTIPCAAGTNLTFIATFLPAEDIGDLGGIDMIFDMQVGGPLATTAGFWNWDAAGCNPLGASSGFGRVGGCNAATSTYTNTWAGGASAIAAGNRGPSNQRVAVACARTSGLAVTTNQLLFGGTIVVDLSTASEQGGTTCTGCPLPGCIVFNSGAPGSFSNQPTTTLVSAAVFGQSVTFNGATSGVCAAVPTKKHTWGQLKSLYR